MKTVQLAIPDSEYAAELQSLLVRDGTHRVYLVERPDLGLDGVVLIAANNSENLALLESDPERFIVVTKEGSDNLSRIWKAGARHVVFEKDPPHTAQLAIFATELQLAEEFTPQYPPQQIARAGTVHRLRVQ
jgi:hypothetical protein